MRLAEKRKDAFLRDARRRIQGNRPMLPRNRGSETLSVDHSAPADHSVRKKPRLRRILHLDQERARGQPSFPMTSRRKRCPRFRVPNPCAFGDQPSGRAGCADRQKFRNFHANHPASLDYFRIYDRQGGSAIFSITMPNHLSSYDYPGTKDRQTPSHRLRAPFALSSRASFYRIVRPNPRNSLGRHDTPSLASNPSGATSPPPRSES